MKTMVQLNIKHLLVKNRFDLRADNIMWLTVDNIQEKESAEISEPAEVPNMVGSGVSVGAVVSDTVGPSTSRQVVKLVCN